MDLKKQPKINTDLRSQPLSHEEYTNAYNAYLQGRSIYECASLIKRGYDSLARVAREYSWPAKRNKLLRELEKKTEKGVLKTKLRIREEIEALVNECVDEARALRFDGKQKKDALQSAIMIDEYYDKLTRQEKGADITITLSDILRAKKQAEEIE